MGVMAGDYESYTLFAPLLNNIIREYHDFSPTSRHTTDLNPGHLKSVKDLDPNSEYVLSTRIRVARSVAGLPFPSSSKAVIDAASDMDHAGQDDTLHGNLDEDDMIDDALLR